MISKDGHYWTTGITVTWQERAGGDQNGSYSGWRASLDFLDDGFNDDDPDAGRISTQGTLYTRYAVRDGQTAAGLSAAIDALLADAERLGVRVGMGGESPSIYYSHDGEDPEWPPPVGWRQLLAAERVRLGWKD